MFMSFVAKDGDASRLIERDCFLTWVATRKKPPLNPTESFRRVLTAHVCGISGRKPFPKPVEKSLLQVIRLKQIWPCFRNTGITIGIRGFRKKGYHESAKLTKPVPTNFEAKAMCIIHDTVYQLLRLQDMNYVEFSPILKDTSRLNVKCLIRS